MMMMKKRHQAVDFLAKVGSEYPTKAESNGFFERMRFGMRADPKLGPRFCCFDEILVVYMGELLGNQEKHHPGQSPEVEIRSKKTPDPGPSKTIFD